MIHRRRMAAMSCRLQSIRLPDREISLYFTIHQTGATMIIRHISESSIRPADWESGNPVQICILTRRMTTTRLTIKAHVQIIVLDVGRIMQNQTEKARTASRY